MTIATKALTITAAALIGAFTLGQFTERAITTEIEINAPAATVWQTLTQSDDIAGWNPFIKRLDGTLAEGATLAVTVQAEGKSPMNFTPTVLVADTNRGLRWVSKLGVRGVFDGEHYFVLQETPAGTTKFLHGENFRGALAAILFRLIGEDTKAGFEAMNTALKARAEAV